MKYIEINNFKSIKNLKIDGFKKINLIAGCNNSGKSSILEAIFLLQKLNSSEIWNILVNGVLTRVQTATGENFDKMAGLFYKFDFSQTLSVSNDSSSIQMSLAKELQIANPTSNITNNIEAIAKPPESQEVISEAIRVNIKFDQMDMSVDILKVNTIKAVGNISPTTTSKPCFFVDEANSIKTGQPNYSIFNALGSIVSNNKKQELINNALKIFDSRITDIETIINKYNQPEIKIGHEEFTLKLPLSSYGMGVKRALNIIMAIINSKDGVVLIDEIENGIHHSIMPKLWEVIIDLTKKYNCQLFATTHSQEYAEYILNNNTAWDSCKDDFNFITLNLYKNQKIVPSIYSGSDFESSILDDKSELRG